MKPNKILLYLTILLILSSILEFRLRRNLNRRKNANVGTSIKIFDLTKITPSKIDEASNKKLTEKIVCFNQNKYSSRQIYQEVSWQSMVNFEEQCYLLEKVIFISKSENGLDVLFQAAQHTSNYYDRDNNNDLHLNKNYLKIQWFKNKSNLDTVISIINRMSTKQLKNINHNDCLMKVEKSFITTGASKAFVHATVYEFQEGALLSDLINEFEQPLSNLSSKSSKKLDLKNKISNLNLSICLLNSITRLHDIYKLALLDDYTGEQLTKDIMVSVKNKNIRCSFINYEFGEELEFYRNDHQSRNNIDSKFNQVAKFAIMSNNDIKKMVLIVRKLIEFSTNKNSLPKTFDYSINYDTSNYNDILDELTNLKNRLETGEEQEEREEEEKKAEGEEKKAEGEEKKAEGEEEEEEIKEEEEKQNSKIFNNEDDRENDDTNYLLKTPKKRNLLKSFFRKALLKSNIPS